MCVFREEEKKTHSLPLPNAFARRSETAASLLESIIVSLSNPCFTALPPDAPPVTSSTKAFAFVWAWDTSSFACWMAGSACSLTWSRAWKDISFRRRLWMQYEKAIKKTTRMHTSAEDQHTWWFLQEAIYWGKESCKAGGCRLPHIARMQSFQIENPSLDCWVFHARFSAICLLLTHPKLYVTLEVVCQPQTDEYLLTRMKRTHGHSFTRQAPTCWPFCFASSIAGWASLSALSLEAIACFSTSLYWSLALSKRGWAFLWASFDSSSALLRASAVLFLASSMYGCAVSCAFACNSYNENKDAP